MIIEFSVYLAATLIVIRRLINRARTVYRWPTRPFGTAPGFDCAGIPTPSPYSSVALPSSYASREITFGRRLHRFATERARYIGKPIHESRKQRC